MTSDTPHGVDQPTLDELYPVVMIYLTVRLEGARGWSEQVRVATPDGVNTIETWGRSGGSIPHGQSKCVDDLMRAFEVGHNHLSPF